MGRPVDAFMLTICQDCILTWRGIQLHDTVGGGLGLKLLLTGTGRCDGGDV